MTEDLFGEDLFGSIELLAQQDAPLPPEVQGRGFSLSCDYPPQFSEITVMCSMVLLFWPLGCQTLGSVLIAPLVSPFTCSLVTLTMLWGDILQANVQCAVAVVAQGHQRLLVVPVPRR